MWLTNFLFLFETTPKPISVKVTGASSKLTNSVNKLDASRPALTTPPPAYIIGFFELINNIL